MIWRPDPVEQEPICELWNACLYLTLDDQLYLVGENRDGGRVSSYITYIYDIPSFCSSGISIKPNVPFTYFKTRSGRIYEVTGVLDGYSSLGHYVLGEWLQINELKFEQLTKVTFDYITNHWRVFYPERLLGKYSD